MLAELAQGVQNRPPRTGGRCRWRTALILAALLLSPASAYADLAPLTDDTYIAASSADVNAGNAASVRIQAPTMAQILAGMPVFPNKLGSGGTSSIALLKFDLSWIPTGTPITRARVIVFVKRLHNFGTLAVHRVGLAYSCSPWAESAVTWKTAPPVNHTAELASGS